MNSTHNNFIKCEKPIKDVATCGKETICRQLLICTKETTNTSACVNSYCFCVRAGQHMTKENKICAINKVQSGPEREKISLQMPSDTIKLNGSTNSNVSLSNTNATEFSTNISYTNSTNFTTDSLSIDITKAENFLNVPIPVWIIIAVSIVLVLLITIAVYYTNCSVFYLFGLKKKKSDKNKTPPPVQLGITVMTDQRYTTNPSYSPHNTGIDMSIGSVPLLSRNSITDLEKIGEGFFGEVYKGQLHSIDNEKEHVETVAVKRLKRTANQEALEDFLREVEIISSFHHPNILTLVGVCPQENTSPPWMIFEYMSFGDLADVLRNSNHEFWESGRDLPTLSAEALLSISSQIAAGMEYLAAQRFVHRDLACRNCLVGSSLTVKISDFGMSRDVYTCDYYRVGGKRMLPIRWMSPEGLSYGKFTLESDVWSYGVVLWEIYSYGKQPYFGYTNEQAMKLIGKFILLEIPENCPNEVADIMRSCWQINPKDRIQFLDICNRLSALKECIDEISLPPLPRPPPMPVTINYPLPFDEDEFDDILDDDNYLKPASTRSSLFIEPSISCNLCQDFAPMIKNPELSDVVLVLSKNGKEYPAHKTILAARSPAFADMFKHHKEKGKKIERVNVTDMDEYVFDEILRYIYTGRCEKIEKLTNDLLIAALKLRLDGLKTICVQQSCKNLTIGNAVDTVLLADEHGLDELKSKAIRFIADNYAQVSNTTDWKHIVETNGKLVHEVCQSVIKLHAK